MLRSALSDRGWSELRFIDASDAVHVRGLAEIAARVELGYLPRNTPIFVGRHRSDAPYPDVVMGIPTDEATARACLAGDPSVLADLVEALEEALEGFLAQVKAGKLN